MAGRLREVEEKSEVAVREAGEKLSKATSELTTLRHQSMWNEREGGIKQSALVRELDSLRDTVQRKDAATALAEGRAEEVHRAMVSLQVYMKVVICIYESG